MNGSVTCARPETSACAGYSPSPDFIRRRLVERPDDFRLLARLDDQRLERVRAFLGSE